MQTHISIIGDLPLSDVTIPRSHDAGMYTKTWGTKIGGTENNILTQTQTILRQLEYGTRIFDIRPTFHSGEWYCGHYTNTSSLLGWQGGNGASIRDVISDVNGFLGKNPELVIIEIDHVGVMDGEMRDCVDEERADLLNLLSTFRPLYQGNTKDVRHDSVHVNDYIRDNNPCVVVAVASDCHFNPDHLVSRGFYLFDPPIRERKDRGLCRMQTNDEALNCTIMSLGRDHHFSVLNLNKVHVAREFPAVLQDMARNYPSTISLDNIHNVDGLTVSLATTYHRHNVIKGNMDPVIVYGGRLITSSETTSRVTAAILKQEDYVVSNENLGGDPLEGVVKSCAVYYHSNGFVKGRFAWEGQALCFSQDIHRIVYGGVEITNQAVYNNIFHALNTGSSFHVTNGGLGGDPAPNVPKTCTIEYSSGSSLRKRRTAAENEQVDFGQDIFSVEYGGSAITDPAVLENIFSAMKHGTRFLVCNVTMACDPKVGVTKTCRISYKNGSRNQTVVVEEDKFVRF